MKWMPFALLLISLNTGAQPKVWVKLENGNALFLDPLEQKWVPISTKEELPLKTFLLTKENTKVVIFRETDSYMVSEKMYCFIEDMIPKSRVEIISSLTQIEAAELPSQPTFKEQKQRTIGVTYGESKPVDPNEAQIPYLTERRNAVQFFVKNNRLDAALLSQKRLMIKFPSLYQNVSHVETLFSLYDKLELYGFLGDETRRLALLQPTDELGGVVLKWSEIAKRKLTLSR